MNASLAVLLINAASTLYLTGLIWTIQRVHYPSFAYVSTPLFSEFETFHQRRITWIVVPVMLIEAVTTMLLFVLRPSALPVWIVAVGALLLAVVWLSTFLLQVPLHAKLANAYDAGAMQRLIRTNWCRTIAWTARAGVMFVALICVLHDKRLAVG